MRLLKTGAFVRQVRSARTCRIAHSSSSPSNSARLTPPPSAVRWSSIQAAPQSQSFPEQSVDPSREVDPAKTAAQSSLSHPSETDTFKQHLQNLGKENQIIHESRESGSLILGKPYVFDYTTNVPQSILDLVGRNLYDNPDHPLCITRKLIESCFPSPEFNHFIQGDPIVTVQENFDVLGFPQDHPGRSRTDTYYVNSSHLLRTHTSAHQHAAFKSLALEDFTSGYTICADVYRRDSIDKSHFPIFHQMEGAKVWALDGNITQTRYNRMLARQQTISNDLANLPKPEFLQTERNAHFDPKTNPVQKEHDRDETILLVSHLKRSLELLIETVLRAAQAASARKAVANEPIKARWIEAYFPFTSPSFEIEVQWNDTWLELLGCGIVQQPILTQAGLREHVGWAWGLGVERFAMLLFGIPDIRLFWSTDRRFLKQFCRGRITQFEPFSKYPACYKDIAFWISPTPATGTPMNANPVSSGVAAAAGGDSTKASLAETQPAAFHENDIMEVVRDVAGNLAEDVTLVDEFVHPTSGRKSVCYRINYRSLERTLLNDEVNALHDEVAKRIVGLHGVELR
ncbi:uncharacterized protein A1O9_05789 [Exophiala aquamarina CBS 119918]|uniref:Phenylalanine--tRNA ligase, mitochondrial n=1 Tax=Exophiala aquamarina CBS 119918 TaxID=1182545 RepID=A0A072PF40_9EURO|nr:uncharacterized protein A1O9_05789 [Exophiala aquamarina CBS 119918]KEF57868.1 hypothetical protein A1O9_05789 [Exophiala aquamarina CBS 119918]